jgi:hypothetical protein
MFKYAFLITLHRVYSPKASIHVAQLILFYSSGDFRVQCRWQQWHSSWYGLRGIFLQ